jgi:hypothetical protein
MMAYRQKWRRVIEKARHVAARHRRYQMPSGPWPGGDDNVQGFGLKVIAADYVQLFQLPATSRWRTNSRENRMTINHLQPMADRAIQRADRRLLDKGMRRSSIVAVLAIVSVNTIDKQRRH